MWRTISSSSDDRLCLISEHENHSVDFWLSYSMSSLVGDVQLLVWIDRHAEAAVRRTEVWSASSHGFDDGNTGEVASDRIKQRSFQLWCICMLSPDAWQTWSALYQWRQARPHPRHCGVLRWCPLSKSAWKTKDVFRSSLLDWSV